MLVLLLFIGYKRKQIFNLVVVCEKKKRVGGEYFLLGNLYYFIKFCVKIKTWI